MNARIQLTDKERAQIRKDLYEEKKHDFRFIFEAMGEAKPRVAAMIIAGFVTDDAELFLKGCQQSLVDYIESELCEEAERDLLAGIEISGGRRLA